MSAYHLSEAELEARKARAIESWDPCERAVHCSNCAHAIVFGYNAAIVAVRCEKGHGKGPVDLWRLIRNVRPWGFRAAAGCPDFESMSDDEIPDEASA